MLFLGCSTKQNIYLVFKSNYINFSDQGFLEKSIFYKKITIYRLGQKPFVVLIKKDLVCLNNSCINKRIFISKLCKDCPYDILDKIFNKEPLDFLGEKYYIKDGFIQKKDPYYYKVTKKNVLFKNREVTIFYKNMIE